MALNLDWHSQCHLAATGIRNTVESFAWSVMNLCPPLFMIEVLPLGYTGLHPRPPAPPIFPTPFATPSLPEHWWQLAFYNFGTTVHQRLSNFIPIHMSNSMR